ncbi:hypothetical protein GCM10007205_20100 [Oxalicibacterium flavum]|uniref:HipA-like kinase domain-containing protein n=1 Tax=Oxalicibacterium flavum TaxID=179467 RepID=A0A8J2UN10_9BURK|nr:HipA family kinase [Oxalicibacterium flavum]GGC10885.1 hypothetical protein GCM10007205_20100 [Oxalicibacterium flavum]
MPVEIVEVIRRSDQGVTLPFICRGDDDGIYFVKGRGAGRRSLLAEYIGGRLAQAFGLPIADFAIVNVPQELIRASLSSDIADLGAGLAFGSRSHPHVQELLISQVTTLDREMRKDVLVFDWWIHNSDRTLTTRGGNPNLLWDQATEQLVVIDHNTAFESPFDCQAFATNHIFSELLPEVFDDLVEREHYIQRLERAFLTFDVACDSLPEDWWWVDDGVPAPFERVAIRDFLASFNSDFFWSVK